MKMDKRRVSLYFPPKTLAFVKNATLAFKKAHIITNFLYRYGTSCSENLFQGNCHVLLPISIFGMYPIYK